MYGIDGLPHWEEEDIICREYLVNALQNRVRKALLNTNAAWQMVRIEAPILLPENMISEAYSVENDDYYYVGGELALRSETTQGSYNYIQAILKSHPQKWQRPPICIWQVGKSFRKKQGQPAKYYHYKEFYQLEFQCIYTKGSKCDYFNELVKSMSLIRNVRVTSPERIPLYSSETMDLEMMYRGRWVGVARISKRIDFDDKHEVVEIAFGLGRLVQASRGLL